MLLTAAAVAVVAVPVAAQHADAGTTAFPFLNLHYDARTVAMGGASVAVPNDFGVLANPASAGYSARKQIHAGYRQLILDVWGGVLGAAIPTRFHGIVLAPYLITVSSGSFDIVDDGGEATGERAASAYTALGVTAARALSRELSVGVTIKGMYHYMSAGQASYAAQGAAVDAGVQYRARGNRLIYGAAARNFGVMRSYWGIWNEYDLPFGIEGGVSYVPRHIPNLRAALDVNIYRGDYMNFEPAVEYAVIRNTLFLRGGYNFSSMDLQKTLDVFRGERDDTYQKSSINSLSLGLGLATTMDNADIKFDAALQLYTDITAPALALTLSVGF